MHVAGLVPTSSFLPHFDWKRQQKHSNKCNMADCVRAKGVLSSALAVQGKFFPFLCGVWRAQNMVRKINETQSNCHGMKRTIKILSKMQNAMKSLRKPLGTAVPSKVIYLALAGRCTFLVFISRASHIHSVKALKAFDGWCSWAPKRTPRAQAHFSR